MSWEVNYMKDIKNAVAGFALLMATFSLSTNANASSHDADGFRTEPSCDKFSTMAQVVLNRSELPTGKKASNDKWDMEIYENKATGSWTLLARNKNAASKFEESCILISSDEPSYTQEKWYKKYFQTAAPQATQ